MQTFVALGCYVILNGRCCDPGERGVALRTAAATALPLERLLLASDAPFATPQNIPVRP